MTLDTIVAGLLGTEDGGLAFIVAEPGETAAEAALRAGGEARFAFVVIPWDEAAARPARNGTASPHLPPELEPVPSRAPDGAGFAPNHPIAPAGQVPSEQPPTKPRLVYEAKSANWWFEHHKAEQHRQPRFADLDYSTFSTD